ncbi:MAG: hypothetical protein HY716_01180 [Planctomycetes bacterium]|nr:hypothetical protein [Planctomycetota bacterium]
MNRRKGATSRTRFRVPPQRKNPTPWIVGGVGGGVLLVVVIVAAASSGAEEVKPAPKVEAPAPPPPPVERSVEETGHILFICANAPNHEDKEVIFSSCPSCRKSGRFFMDAGSYRCADCGHAFPNSDLRCPECGRPPRRTKIKHR